MLLKNLDQANKLVNGSRGVVVGFEPPPSVDRLKRVQMHPPTLTPLLPKVSFQVDPTLGDDPKGWVTRLVFPEDYTVEVSRAILRLPRLPPRLPPLLLPRLLLTQLHPTLVRRAGESSHSAHRSR